MNVLVVIDMQNDFITGCLGNEQTQKVVPNVVNKILDYKKTNPNGALVYTMDTHSNGTYADTIEGMKLPVPHCIAGTEGWSLHPDVEKVIEGGVGVTKTTFGSTKLVDIISRIENVKNITLIGVCTDICVISNALLLKANFPNTPITVDSACCAGVTPESHENALNAMRMCHIDIV